MEVLLFSLNLYCSLPLIAPRPKVTPILCIKDIDNVGVADFLSLRISAKVTWVQKCMGNCL